MKRVVKKVLGAVLAGAFLAGLLPAASTQTQAAGGTWAMNFGMTAINRGDTLYYGTADHAYRFDARWYVLDNQLMNTGGRGVFLTTEHLVGNRMPYGGVWYNVAMDQGNRWDGSRAQAWCDDFLYQEGRPAEHFSQREIAAMAEQDLADEAYVAESGVAYGEMASAGQKLFFLSANEVDHYLSGAGRAAAYGGNTVPYLLRSPAADRTTHIGRVDANGYLGTATVSTAHAARPAINLTAGSALLVTAVDDGKPVVADPAEETLTTIGPVAYGTPMKLTLIDEAKFGAFTARIMDVTDGAYTVEFSGAGATAQDYVSAAVITGSEVRAYSQISRGVSSGRVVFHLNEALASSDRLIVFAEEIHGGNATDYASRPVALPVHGYDQARVQADVEQMLYYGGVVGGTAETEEEPVIATVAEPETMTLVEPMEEPVTLTVAEPETATAAEPETVTSAEPETVTAAEPETETVAEPEAVTVTATEPEAAEPGTGTDAGPFMLATRAQGETYQQFNESVVRAFNTDTSGAVIIDGGQWTSINRAATDAWQARPDVDVMIIFKSFGRSYYFVVPAGTDMSVLPGNVGYTGFLYIAKVTNSVPMPLE